MPVLVVGADTPIGLLVMESLSERAGEIRAFVSSPDQASDLRSHGVKVALGDVSDGSHVGGAALNCFSIVFLTAAAEDHRERAFATTPNDVFSAWVEAIEMAQPRRVIWVGASGSGPPRGTIGEFAVVEVDGRSAADVAAEVAYLDDLETLPS